MTKPDPDFKARLAKALADPRTRPMERPWLAGPEAFLALSALVALASLLLAAHWLAAGAPPSQMRAETPAERAIP